MKYIDVTREYLPAIITAVKIGYCLRISKPEYSPATWAIDNGAIYTRAAILGDTYARRYDKTIRDFIVFVDKMQRNGYKLQLVPRELANFKTDPANYTRKARKRCNA